MPQIYTVREETGYTKTPTGVTQQQETRVNIQRSGSIRSDEPKYLKLYLDHLANFKSCPEGCGALLLSFAEIMTWGQDSNGTGGNLVYINAAWKRHYLESHGYKSRTTLVKQINALIAAKLIYKVESGVYMVSPHIFGRGDWVTNGIKSLRATYDYMTGEVTTEMVANEKSEG